MAFLPVSCEFDSELFGFVFDLFGARIGNEEPKIDPRSLIAS